MHHCLSEAHRIFRDAGIPTDELEVEGFGLYELTILHPQAAAAA